MIDATYAVLSRRGGVGSHPLAPGTLARVHVVLRAAFAQAVRWGWVWDNPIERAHRVVTVTRELRPPTPQELRALLEHVAARDRQFHTLLVLAAFTGARRAQLLGLRWHNVHLATKRVSFSAGWVEGPDGPVLTATKTKRRHVVDLDPATVSVLVDLAPPAAATPGQRLSSSATTVAPPRGNRIGSPRPSCGIDAIRGYDRSGYMTCATSWPPRCSTPASRW
jgi:integrase